MTVYNILVSLGISTEIATKAYVYAKLNHLDLAKQHKLICCVVKKYDPGQYPELEQQYPKVVQDCSPDDDCTAILAPAGL